MIFQHVLQNKRSNSYIESNTSFVKHFTVENYDYSQIYKFIDSFKENESIKDKINIVSIFGESTEYNVDMKCEIIRKMIGIRPRRPRTMNVLFKNQYIQIDGFYNISKGIVILYLTSLLDSQLQQEYEKLFPNNDELLLQNPEALLGLYKSLLLLFTLSHAVISHYSSPRFDSSSQRLFQILSNFSKKFKTFICDAFRDNEKLKSSKDVLKRDDGRFCVPKLLFTFDCRNETFITLNNYLNAVHSMQNHIVCSLESVINQQYPLFNLSTDEPFVYFIIQDKTNHYSIQNFLMNSNLKSDQNISLSTFLSPHIYSSNQISSLSFFNALECLLSLLKNDKNDEKVQFILDSLKNLLDVNGRFSEKICQTAFMIAIKFYQEKLPQFYNRKTHETKREDAVRLFQEISRGKAMEKFTERLVKECNNYWNNGRELCEAISLTGNSCINRFHVLPDKKMSKKANNKDADGEKIDENATETIPKIEHSNMIKYISACNCGRRQGKRPDPFTLKAANYDFYQKMKLNCRTCRVIESIHFPESKLSKSKYQSKKSKFVNASDQILECKKEINMAKEKKPAKETADLIFSQSDSSQHNSINYSENDEDDEDEDKDEESEEELEEETESKVEENDESSELNGCDDSLNSEEFQDDDDDNDDDNDDQDDDDDQDDEYEDEDFSVQVDDDVEDDDEQDKVEAVQEMQEEINYEENSSKVPLMLHTKCHPDSLPNFPSWSLVKLGHSSLYSHDKGLKDQQGFVKGSNFLMPWNVRVLMEHRKGDKLWGGKPPSGIKQKKRINGGTEFTVKIFLGTEYECLKGHRFICSGPNEILRRETEKKVKDEKIQADLIANNNMPIYIHCMCHKNNSASIAQLMRIHIVTPKVPINVTINPFVQISDIPDLPLFYPGQKEPIRLEQASYWVLRLPLVYEKDDGPILLPKNGDLPKEFCLLNGCYGISNEFDIR